MRYQNCIFKPKKVQRAPESFFYLGVPPGGQQFGDLTCHYRPSIEEQGLAFVQRPLTPGSHVKMMSI